MGTDVLTIELWSMGRQQLEQLDIDNWLAVLRWYGCAVLGVPLSIVKEGANQAAIDEVGGGTGRCDGTIRLLWSMVWTDCETPFGS
jgi:hypothetical protein